MITAKKAYEIAKKNNEEYLTAKLDEFYAYIENSAKMGHYSRSIDLKNDFTINSIVQIAQLLYYDGYDITIIGDEERENLEKICISWNLDSNKYAEIWYRYENCEGDKCSENLVAKYNLKKVKKDCL